MLAHTHKSSTASRFFAIICANSERSWERQVINVCFNLPLLTITYYFLMPAENYKPTQRQILTERLSYPPGTLSIMAFMFFVLLLLVCLLLNFYYVLDLTLRLNMSHTFSASIQNNPTASVSK